MTVEGSEGHAIKIIVPELHFHLVSCCSPLDGGVSGSRPLGRTLLARLSLLNVASLLVLVLVLRAWAPAIYFEDEMRGRGRRGPYRGRDSGACGADTDTLLPVPQ